MASQRQGDVIAFLDQIESKMGKQNIDGLVGKLKMKHPKFIVALKSTVISQVCISFYSIILPWEEGNYKQIVV